VRRIPINPPLIVSAAAIVLATVIALWHLPQVLGALITPTPGDDPTQARLQQYLVAHAEDLATYRDRFDGRSLFFKPQPPIRTVSTPPPRREAPKVTGPPKPPPVARTYGGPSVNFVLGDEVWFHDGERVRVGEEGSNGVTVISADPPWSVRLGHLGGEYEIELFKRTYPGFADAPHKPRPVPGLVEVQPDGDGPAGPSDQDTASTAP
jgi:hypothetical protein